MEWLQCLDPRRLDPKLQDPTTYLVVGGPVESSTKNLKDCRLDGLRVDRVSLVHLQPGPSTLDSASSTTLVVPRGSEVSLSSSNPGLSLPSSGTDRV